MKLFLFKPNVSFRLLGGLIRVRSRNPSTKLVGKADEVFQDGCTKGGSVTF